MEELRSLVTAAKNGDKDAFGRIVSRFQDMAYGCAYTILGNSSLAQDAAQEAFIDAYLSLPNLRQPEAFPGWFRRILIKHSDRQIRGKRVSTVPFEAAISLPSATPDPEAALEGNEVRQVLHDAIAALPQKQGLVTTLFYVKGYSQKEIAVFLELPITAIKKHLYTARKKLKERMITMLQENLQESRPSQSGHLANKVKFFIALKTGDMGQVKKLLEKDPALIHAQTEWGVASDGYYWPIGFTALHWASCTGNEPLLTFLLSHGADVNAKGSSGMTPLHVAVLMRQPEMVRLLLEHGADVSAETGMGLTPLHYAVIKNGREIASVLLEKGANVKAADKKGQAPIDWAAMKGRQGLVDLLAAHGATKPTDYPLTATSKPTSKGRARLVPIGESVLGRVLDGIGKPIDGLALLDDVSKESVYRPAGASRTPILETGIKIIDLFAPVKRGGYIGVFTPLPGVGKQVILSQIAYNMATFHDGCAVCIGLEDGAYTGSSMMLGWRESGMDEKAVGVFGQADDSASKRLQVAETGLTIAENFRKQGHDVLLLVDGKLALSDGVLSYLRANTFSTLEAAITTVYYGDYTVGAEPETLADLDAVITFDRGRSKQGLWPAIDPLRSRSRLLQARLTDETHVQAATRAWTILQRYYDLQTLVADRGLDALPDDEDRQIAIRARRLDLFLTQPFSVAEPWTGTPGCYVSVEDTIGACQGLLRGQYDSLPEEAFYLRGTIDQAIEKAKH